MQEINKTNLTRLREESCQWAQYAGFDKQTDLEEMLDINKEIQEAYDSRKDMIEFHKELADIVIISVSMIDNVSEFVEWYKDELKCGVNMDNLDHFFTCLLYAYSPFLKLSHIIRYCVQNDIDIITICEEKLEYNYTRPEYKRG